MTPWLITYHAAVRFAERVNRTITPEEATLAIESLLPTATLLPDRTLKNSERWALTGIDAVIVARLDPKIGARVAVTVLGPHEMVEDGVAKAVMAAYLRVTKFVEPPGPPEPTAKKKRQEQGRRRRRTCHSERAAQGSDARAPQAFRNGGERGLPQPLAGASAICVSMAIPYQALAEKDGVR